MRANYLTPSRDMEAPVHVLRVIPSYFPYVTGPANQARAISQGLAPLGFHSHLVTTNLGAPSAPGEETRDGVTVTRLPIRAGFMQYHVAPGAWAHLTRLPADVIHVHSYRSFLADVAALAARRRRLPFILQLHGTLAGYRHIVQGGRRWFYQAYDVLTAALPTLRADRIVVSTSAEASEVQRYGLDMQRVRVIPMGIDVDDYVFPDERRDEKGILFVGRLAENRNVEQLLYALRLIVDLPWTCTIVGGEERSSYSSLLGYAERLQRLARDLGISERVCMTGPQHGEELRRIYSRAGIFVYPSRYENFGQTILEAGASGCALITTRVGVAHDLIKHGESGLLVDHDASGQLAEHLRRLLDHPSEQAALGDAIQQRVRVAYTWPPIYRQYVELYQEVLCGLALSRVGATPRALPQSVNSSVQRDGSHA